ncbi:hypothetical protein G6F35_018962 [Rhizopus arrhizus]|nr:hypothetical protein G6F35_018962 [Rhizopus arrhizus]
MLSRLLGFVMGFSNGSQLVMTAFGGTAIVFEVPVHRRRGHPDRRAGQHLPATARADADHLGHGYPGLLGLHAG